MPPKESMQKVVWSDTIVDGGKIKELYLPQPEAYEGFYEDISLFALPVKEEVADVMPAKITCTNINSIYVRHIFFLSCSNNSIVSNNHIH